MAGKSKNMEKITLPKIVEKKVSDDNSIFTIEPLYPGYGPTIGNTLRRVLLSSLEGTAMTSFKVEGITHEFTSIPHVKEDMIELMLNLKEINYISHSNEPVILTLSKKGPGEVTAKDFKANSQIEIVNEDVLICGLDNKANFELEVVVERNRGFVTIESGEETAKEIGRIMTDAAFSPIERVKLSVENTRVGQMTNYDKLILDIKTDGTVEPKNAVIEASNVLIDHYKQIAFNVEVEEKLTEEIAPKPTDKKSEEETISVAIKDPKTKIEEAGFSARTTNALVNAGIKSVAGLKRLSGLKLSEIKGLGNKGIDEIKEMINA